MNHSDEEKKLRERIILIEALGSARLKGGEARRNADRINGEIHCLERPDLLIDTQANRSIGIEHFRVDHYVKQDKKASSKAAEFTATIEKERKKVVAEDGIDSIDDNMVDLIGKKIAEATKMFHNACVNDILRSFEMRILDDQSGHLPKVQNYKDHLRQIRVGSTTEIGFLIEIHSDFRNLFMHSRTKVHRVEYGEFPMVREVYELLRGISEKVDWLILAFYGGMDTNLTDAAIIHCANGLFRRSAERQHLAPVEYIGLGKSTPSHPQRNVGNVQAKLDDEKVVYTFDNNCERVDSEKLFRTSLEGAARAFNFAREKKPFVVTFPVEMIYELVYDRAIQSVLPISENDVLRFLHEIGYEEFQIRSDRFAKKWGIIS